MRLALEIALIAGVVFAIALGVIVVCVVIGAARLSLARARNEARPGYLVKPGAPGSTPWLYDHEDDGAA